MLVVKPVMVLLVLMDGERSDALKSCQGCHDEKHQIAFGLEKGLPHIDHFMANGMDDTELKARVTALQKWDP